MPDPLISHSASPYGAIAPLPSTPPPPASRPLPQPPHGAGLAPIGPRAQGAGRVRNRLNGQLPARETGNAEKTGQPSLAAPHGEEAPPAYTPARDGPFTLDEQDSYHQLSPNPTPQPHQPQASPVPAGPHMAPLDAPPAYTPYAQPPYAPPAYAPPGAPPPPRSMRQHVQDFFHQCDGQIDRMRQSFQVPPFPEPKPMPPNLTPEQQEHFHQVQQHEQKTYHLQAQMAMDNAMTMLNMMADMLKRMNKIAAEAI